MFLEHVNLTVSDMERSAGFYCDLLGLRVRWKGTTSDGTPAAHVGDDRFYLALFQAKAADCGRRLQAAPSTVPRSQKIKPRSAGGSITTEPRAT